MNDQKEIKKNKLKGILPFFWNSYQHMYDVRERNIQTNINFLLIISTFLPILCATLYTTKQFNNLIILIPIFFQILALLFLLKSFYLPGSNVHWFELKKEFLDSIEKDEFEIKLISNLKSLENATYVNAKAKGELIKNSLHLILFSLFLTLLSIFFILLKGTLALYVAVLAVTSLFSYLVLIYYKKHPSYNYDCDFDESFNLLKKWLK